MLWSRVVTVNDFFPYHPLRLRLGLGMGTSVCAVLTAWAVWNFARTGELTEMMRAGLSLGLGAAMVYTLVRYRPRAGWGVRLTPTALVVSRPSKGTIEIPWSAVREVRRLGKDRDTLSVWTGEENRVLVPRHLFARRSQFDALVRAVEEHLPQSPFDA